MACYQFGPFELDIDKGQLRKYGTSIRIQRQPFLLLRTLVERAGQVVSREDLRQIVWASDTFVDFEHGLNAAMNKVRQALSDPSDQAHYIETLPGQGYRFIAPVESLNQKSAQPASPQPTATVRSDSFPLPSQTIAPTPRFTRQGWWIAAAGIIFLFTGAAWEAVRFREMPADGSVLSLQVNPPEGSEFTFGTQLAGVSISPDGRNLAFVATDRGKTAIWVRPLDGTAAQPLPGTENAGMPFWSPDSKSIAFFALGKLKRIYIAGGTPHTICEVEGRGGSWGENGQILFGGWNSGLFQVAASGGQPSPVTTLDRSRGEVFHYWPQILPDGHFLYFVRSNQRENTGVYAASFAKPHESEQLLNTEANAVYAPTVDGARKHHEAQLLWLRSGTLVAQPFDAHRLRLSGAPHPIADPVPKVGVHGRMEVAVSDSGILVYGSSNPLRQFKRVDRTGKPLAMLGEPALSAFFRLSPDGRRVAVTRVNSVGADLWILDVDRGVSNRFTARPGINVSPVWSPDSQTILFASDVPPNLFRKNASGTGVEQRLTHSANAQFPMDWSRDGKFILYEEDTVPGNQRSLWVLPVTPSDTKPRLYQQTTFNEGNGRFSPDTRWLAFQSDETGRFEIYIDGFPESHGRVRISTGGGVLPEWSSDGRELFFVSADSTLMSVSLRPGAVSLPPSIPHALFPLLVTDTDVSPYDVTLDRQHFVVLEAAAHAVQSLTVVSNWPALLSRATNSQ